MVYFICKKVQPKPVFHNGQIYSDRVQIRHGSMGPEHNGGRSKQVPRKNDGDIPCSNNVHVHLSVE
jgi:hypothetical protein